MKKQPAYFYDKHGNKLKPYRHKIDTRLEPEDDDQQIEALLVDMGMTDLMFDRNSTY